MRQQIEEILQTKGLAALGDALLNFALSVAKTRATGTPCATRVENRLMIEAIQSSATKNHLPKRLSRHEKADFYEGLIGHAWLKGQLELDEIIGALHKSLKGRDLAERVEERTAILHGLQQLLAMAEQLLLKEED